MANATKLPELDTFQDPAQLGHLQALRSTVLKNRREYFANNVDGNRWFSQVDRKLEELKRAHQQAPGVRAPRASAHGAVFSSHLTAREVVPRTKKNDGVPIVKVMQSPRSASGSAVHRPPLVEEPVRATVVGSARPGTARPALRAPGEPLPAIRNRSMRVNPRQATQQESSARPALMQGAGVMRTPAARAPYVAPHVAARAVAALPLHAALDMKYRHTAMLSDVFGLLKQAGLEAHHGNADAAEHCVSQAENIHQALLLELVEAGDLSVVRPLVSEASEPEPVTKPDPAAGSAEATG